MSRRVYVCVSDGVVDEVIVPIEQTCSRLPLFEGES
jgi:hypothetical protein